jgi:glyceraldehyde 3-phosphate dehydrogenase
MSTLKAGINGFGRIGRLVLRRLLETKQAEIVHINDLADIATLTYLFKYDTVHGVYPGKVSHDETHLHIDNHKILVTREADPTNLNWGGVDIVVESTGKFTTMEKASLHLASGAKRVIISAPAKGEVDATVVLGVNDEILSANMKVVSNASCTTNCLGVMAKVLDEHFGIERGFMTTVHAYTADQRLVDTPHSDLRRARSAAENIVPTTTGAAKAIGLVLPHLKGKLDGVSVRVPVADGSLTDLKVVVTKPVTVQAINAAMKAAAEGALKGLLEYSEDPLVSSDIVHNSHSCVFDALSTMVNGNLVSIAGWYDNEWGYACRTSDLIARFGSL